MLFRSGEDIEPNSTLANDLARVDIILSIKGNEPEIIDAHVEVKYNSPSLLDIQPLKFDEIRLVNGPAVEMSMEEAYKALGGNMEDFKNSEYIEYNGVTLLDFCSSVVEISVNTPDYETPRGLKVGDTAEKVESLYGKPDAGFSGDDHVMYKCTGADYVNYYRGLDIYYNNNIVESFLLYQVILD